MGKKRKQNDDDDSDDPVGLIAHFGMTANNDSGNLLHTQWAIDTACSRHITHSREHFISYEEIPESACHIKGLGGAFLLTYWQRNRQTTVQSQREVTSHTPDECLPCSRLRSEPHISGTTVQARSRRTIYPRTVPNKDQRQNDNCHREEWMLVLGHNSRIATSSPIS